MKKAYIAGPLFDDHEREYLEQIAQIVLDKICIVSNTAPEPIRQQAFAYKENIRKILLDYVALAKKEERASIVNILEKNNGNDLANLIRRL